MQKRISVYSTFAVLLLLVATLFSQPSDRIHQELFKNVQQLRDQCTVQECSRWAPEAFGKAQLYYEQAEQAYEKGDRLAYIQEALKKAQEGYEAALENTRLARVLVEKLEPLERSCRQHNIPAWAPAEFAAAQEKRAQAIHAVEMGNLQLARELVKEAEGRFRTAALQGLRSGPLRQLQNHFQERRDAISIEEYTRANRQLQQAEQFIAEQERSAFDLEGLFQQAKERFDRILPPHAPAREPMPMIREQKAVDLVCEKLTTSATPVLSGDSITVALVIANKSESPVGPFSILIADEDIGPLAMTTVDYMDGGEIRKMEIPFLAVQKGERTIVAEIDPRNLITESIENNNRARAVLIIEDRISQVREAVSAISEGRVLEILARGQLDTTRLPLLYPNTKKRKNWHELVKTQYGEIAAIAGHADKSYPLQLERTTLVIVKVYFSAPEPEKLTVQLVRSDQESPVFFRSSRKLYEAVGLLTAQFPVDEAMLAPGLTWSLRLSNESAAEISAEVMIGLAALMESE